MGSTRKKTVYYIFLLAFAISSILPLLFFLYILLDRGLMDYTRAGLFLLFGLTLAGLGFFLLKRTLKVFTKLSQNLAMTSEGMTIPEPDPELLGKVAEVDSILEAFNALAVQMEKLKRLEHIAPQVEELKSKAERLDNQMSALKELTRIATSPLTPQEMFTQLLNRILEAVQGVWGMLIPGSKEELLETTFISKSPEITLDHQRFLDQITSWVLKHWKPSLAANVPKPRFRGKDFPGPFVSLPVPSEGKALAVIHIGRDKESPLFGEDDLGFLHVASVLLTIAVGSVSQDIHIEAPPVEERKHEEPHAVELESKELPAVELKTEAPPTAEPEPEKPPLTEIEKPRPVSANTVLVVDDEPTVREVLKIFLEGKGYRVITASDGSKALQKMRSELPKVVLLDVNMPDMDGLEFLRIIHREYRDVAVVMITSETEDKVFREAIAMGAYDYVVKPIDFGYLENVLLVKIPDM